jgi:cytoskeletal protein CcmA (bactofilin family)
MFKGNNKDMARTPEPNSPESLNRIVEGTTIEGEIKSESNIRIDGKVKGIIVTKGRLVVGTTGVIDGEVVCKDADIEGSVNGQIRVSGLLSLKETSKFSGDIVTNKLNIQTGAMLSGTLSMGNENKAIKSEHNAIGQGKGEREKALPA